MKKILFLALVLAAGIAAFTSCKKDKNGADDPYELNPADYPETMWRIDSCYMDGEKQRPPHGIIRVLDDKQYTFNGDTMNYAFKDGKLILGQDEVTIAEVKKGWAHLSARGGDVYLSQLPELDMKDQIFDIKASDFVGTWKHAYFVGDSHLPGEPVWHIEGSNPWVETWEFKADGTCIYKDWFSGETKTGTWSWNYGLNFVNNPLESMLVDDKDAITVQPLTKNWFQILRSPDGNNYYYWWFYRVK